jgi:hypothetical protein
MGPSTLKSINMFVGMHKAGVHFIGMPTDPNEADTVDL